MREADWEIGAIQQAARDVSDHFKGFAVGVIGLAIVTATATAIFAPVSTASLGTRVATGVATVLIAVVVLATLVFLLALFVAPYRQRKAARQRIAELEEQTGQAEDRNRIIRNLEALRRDFLKNQPWLKGSGGEATVPKPLLDALVGRLMDAHTQLQPVSPETAGEFADLAKILDQQQTDPRRSTIARFQDDGKRLFDRAIERFATPH